jgi:hypothetical protein
MDVHAGLLTNCAPADKACARLLRRGRFAAGLVRALGLLLAGSLAVCAQDDKLATVNFNNRVLNAGISAPVFEETIGGALLEGETYRAQLYGGPAGTPENLLVPAGAIVDFRSGLAAGFVNVGVEGTRNVPGVNPGERAAVQIRAWSASGGATYEAARTNPAAHSKIGRSNILLLDTPASALSLPVDLVGLQSFPIRHEPMPRVEIVRGGQHAFVLWPLDGSTYEVEWSPTPAASGPWQPVTAPVQLSGARYRVLVSTSSSSCFYRLRLK